MDVLSRSYFVPLQVLIDSLSFLLKFDERSRFIGVVTVDDERFLFGPFLFSKQHLDVRCRRFIALIDLETDSGWHIVLVGNGLFDVVVDDTGIGADAGNHVLELGRHCFNSLLSVCVFGLLNFD